MLVLLQEQEAMGWFLCGTSSHCAEPLALLQSTEAQAHLFLLLIPLKSCVGSSLFFFPLQSGFSHIISCMSTELVQNSVHSLD